MTDDLHDHVLENPGSIPLLPDARLGELLVTPPYVEEPAATGINARIHAEALVRTWLYETRCPSDITAPLTGARWKVSAQFEDALVRVQTLRGPAPDPDALQDYEWVCEYQAVLWDLLRTKIVSYLECDGLLALVPSNDGSQADGVAVPFCLTEDDDFCIDSGESLLEWSRLLRRAQGYLRPYCGVRVPDVFPTDPHLQPVGSSFAVPLLLARERMRADRMPDFRPLDVLATGGFTSGMVQGVTGIGAKRELSRRLGCRLFVYSSDETTGVDTDFFIAPKTSWQKVVPVLARLVPRTRDRHHACRTLTKCLAAIQSPQRASIDPAGWMELWRRVNRCRRLFGTNVQSHGKQCQDAMVDIETQLGLTFASQRKHIDAVLAEYHTRPVYGRGAARDQLDDFVANQPGGLQLIIGRSGYGKTALLALWLRFPRYPANRVDAVFCHFFRADNRWLRGLEEFYRRFAAFLWLHGLGQPPPPEGGSGANSVGAALDAYERLPPRERPRLLIVLDGVDEAEEPYFAPPFGPRIPDGIYVVASARTQSGELVPKSWEEWERGMSGAAIEVGPLDESAVTQWLEGEACLRECLNWNGFRQAVVERSKGCSQWLEDFFGELCKPRKQGCGWRTLLDETPANYRDYVAKQFKASCELDGGGSDDLSKLVALLVAAKAPLNEVDIERIRDHTGQQAVRISVHNLPRQAWRWIGRDPGDAHGLCLRLGNTIVRDAVEAVPSVRRWKSELGPLLRDYCLAWRKHPPPVSPYALRYVIAHLADAGDWPKIVGLTRDSEYRRALQEIFPGEPALLLELLRDALTAASRSKDPSVAATGITSLMLAHAELAHHLRMQASQLVPSQTSLELAGRMVKIVAGWNPTLCVLWKLLLAWELHRHDRSTEMSKVLEELSSSGSTRLVGHQADIAAGLLLRMLDPTDPRLCRLAVLLLDDAGKRYLVAGLARRRDDAGFAGAYAVLRHIDPADCDGRTQQQSRIAILKELSAAGHWSRALNETRQEEPQAEGYLLCELAKAAVTFRRLDMLEDIAGRVDALHKERRDIKPGFRLRCGSYRATVHGLFGRELVLGGQLDDGYKRMERAESIAENLLGKQNGNGDRPSTPARVTALVNLADAWIDLPSPDERKFGKTPARRLLGKAMTAWGEMTRHEDNSNTRLCHRLADLVSVYCRYASSVSGKTHLARRSLKRLVSVESLEFLAQQDLNDFLIRVVAILVEQPSLDMQAAAELLHNIEGHADSSRAISLLAGALAAKGQIGELQSQRDAAWQAYYGLHLLHSEKADDEASVALAQSFARDVLVSSRERDHVQFMVTLAELGASAAQSEDHELSERCFNIALGRARRHERNRPWSISRLRFLLNLSDAATRGRNVRIHRTALKEAWDIGREIEGRHRLGAYVDRGVTGLPEDEAPDGRAAPCPMERESEREEVQIVVALCALGRAQWGTDRSTFWASGLYERIRDRVSSLRNIVYRTAGIAEICEGYVHMARVPLAVEFFQHQECEAERLASRGKGARRDMAFCTAEFVLGLVKAGFPRWALGYASDPDIQKADEGQRAADLDLRKKDVAQRAFAVAYIAAFDRHIELRHDPDAPPKFARTWWDRPAAWSLTDALHKSQEHLDRIHDQYVRGQTIRQLGEMHAAHGRSALALRAADMLGQGREREKLLHRIGGALAKRSDVRTFMELLPSCAWSYPSAYVMLGHLARLYPAECRTIAAGLNHTAYDLCRSWLIEPMN